MDLYELYVSKLNPSLNQLRQRPKTNPVYYLDTVWYENRPVGLDTVQEFMKTLTKDANLTNLKYTNHSIRKTCIGTLDENGIKARHMISLTSHKSESTIRDYATSCSEKKKREMYGILGETMGNPTKIAKKSTPPTSTISKPPLNETTSAENNQIFSYSLTMT